MASLRSDHAAAKDEPADEDESIYVIVETEMPGVLLWRQVGESFYEGPVHQATLIQADGTSVITESWKAEGDAEFSQAKTAFIPEPPTGSEGMHFAFAIPLTATEQSGLQFGYAGLRPIELSDELRRQRD